MSQYRVSAKTEDGEIQAQVTEDLEEALDWFSNGVEAVTADDDPTVAVTLEIDGRAWGVVKEPERE